VHDAHDLPERADHGVPGLLLRRQLHHDVLLTEAAMAYRDPEAPLADAYRHTARAVNAARAHAAYVGAREAHLRELLRRPWASRVTPNWALPPLAGDANSVPIAHDFAAWLAEQGDDAVAAAVFTGPERARLLEQYVQARARVDAAIEERHGMSWADEAAEARAWEMSGHV
jgi:hypothetical protein